MRDAREGEPEEKPDRKAAYRGVVTRRSASEAKREPLGEPRRGTPERASRRRSPIGKRPTAEL